MASLRKTPPEPAMLAEYGLIDDKGDIVDDTPPAWLDELTPERERRDVSGLILRTLMTTALAFAAWVGLLAGLAAVDWARDHWLIALPVAVALIAIVWLIARQMIRDGERATTADADAS